MVLPGRLVGLAEVAELFGVSKRTASRYALRSDFPSPIARLRADPIWLEEDLRDWAEPAPPVKRGRPPRTAQISVVVGEGDSR
jgi:predicted DNA-binding transcriptional regulator AlpA